MKKIITGIIFLFLMGNVNSVFAQNKEKALLENEKKIEAYINHKIDIPLSKVELQKLINEFNHGEHEGTFEQLSKEAQKNHIKAYKKGKLRFDYFKEHPETRQLYKSRPAPMCENGDFESGNFNLYSGESAFSNSTTAGGYTGGECDAIPVNGPGNYGWIPDNMNNPVEDNFMIVTQGLDPIVAQSGAQLNRVNSGNFAARINSPTKLVAPTFLDNPCVPNYGINKLQKTITLQKDGPQDILFTYALVSEFPNHPNQNPIFIARAIDASQNEFDRICVISNPNNNPFFNEFIPTSPDCASNVKVLWKDWTCAKLEIDGNAGDVVTLEFIMTDCGRRGHYGYAYVDDICIESCDPGTEGSINLDPLDPCQELPFDVCGQYTLPILDGQQGSINSITLDILQNGLVVNTLLNPNLTSNTFCFTITANDFPSQNGGYDFRVNASFNVGTNGIQQLNETHTTAGTNNDFIFDNPECCKIDANATNILCDDNGTPNDPSDDTWSFDLTVSNDTNTGFWVANSVLTQSVAYGTTVTVPMGNISNYGTTVDIPISDKEDDTCTTTITVNVPVACSESNCTLEAVTSVGSCNDNGTPNDPSDDYYNITLDVFNTNGEPWMVLNSNMTVIYFGNGDENNINLGNNYLVADQLEWFWVKLNNDPECFVDVTVLAPESCNFTCNISANIATSDCNDNGTPNDPSDDYYYITVDVLGTNGVSWDLVGYPNYQQISYSGTGNETNILLGPISATDPSWVLYITPTGLVDSGCKRFETTVFAPKCSERDPKKNTVSITPNPSKGKVNIQVDTEGDSTVELNIYRIDGLLVKTIQKEKTNTKVLAFDLDLNLPEGLYLFNFITKNGTITKRVIIQ
ncbi:T9SS type A sorting domain-containing protein [uncultured Kordia sp.]|uniref:T9SS type A sorting domain-containing protein n=1 Tax=uncultured Kordia sp. TaxID=507699 RepID=UPI0026179BAD|nr:T9SS type A sorting domain-containing protein [uncultured Kordia sp.]